MTLSPSANMEWAWACADRTTMSGVVIGALALCLSRERRTSMDDLISGEALKERMNLTEEKEKI